MRSINNLLNYRFLITYLRTLVPIFFIIIGIRIFIGDTLLIFTYSDKSESIQIFYQKNGLYTEENSTRSLVDSGSNNVFRFPYPLLVGEYIRIDPTNQSGDVVIEKIEHKYLFWTEILKPSDLIINIKKIQMIDNVELAPTGLLIHSTGNDPAFELYVKRPSLLLTLTTLFFLSILISTLLLVSRKILIDRGIRKNIFNKIQLIDERHSLFLIPLCISLAITIVFYPGFMSYDTLHAIRAARNGVEDSMWPPMVSYVWRAVDLISPNPSAMHFFQVSILFFSLYYLAFNYVKTTTYTTLFIFSYLSIPVVFGTLAVIWKDVLMAAFFLAGLAVITYIKKNRELSFSFLSLILAILLIFLGVCSRHNAITGAVPLLFYLSWVVCTQFIKNTRVKWAGILIIGSLLTGVIFIAKIQLDHYSLPNFKKLTSSNDAFMQPVRVLDVAGASICAGENLFGVMAPNLSIEEISNLYDPRHVNLSKGLFDKVGVDSRINEIWINAAIKHPICFLYNKFQLGKYMIGANRGAQFLITAPSIDENEYGYVLKKSSLRDSFVNYIIHSSSWVFFKPWFLYSLSLITLILMIWSRTIAVDSLTIFLSGGFYFIGLLLFGNATDARLPFYTTTTFFLFIFIAFSEVWRKFRPGNY